MFEQTLRNTRRARGMTQQELAARLFVSRQTVSSWETGRNLPNLETLARLAELLGVSTDYLLGRPARPATSRRLACLPTALAIMAVVRLGVATAPAVLRLSDTMIILLLALLIGSRWAHKSGWYAACALGVGFVGLAWGQIYGMDFGNQFAYVVTGASCCSASPRG